MHVKASVGIAILFKAVAMTLHCNFATLSLSAVWQKRQLYLCARDFFTLTPNAKLLAQQLLQCVDKWCVEKSNAKVFLGRELGRSRMKKFGQNWMVDQR